MPNMAGATTLTSDDYRAAIKSLLLLGQEYELPNGRRVKMADLAELRRGLAQLEAEEAQAGGGGIFVATQFGSVNGGLG